MKRDWGVIRLVLEALEGKTDLEGFLHPGEIKGYDENTVSYHMLLLHEAGLIEARCQEHPNAGIFCLARRLTWEGHELLDVMRSKGLWSRIKTMLTTSGVELSWVAIRNIVAEAIKRSI